MYSRKYSLQVSAVQYFTHQAMGLFAWLEGELATQPSIPVLMVIRWWESPDESVSRLEHGLESLHGVPGGVRIHGSSPSVGCITTTLMATLSANNYSGTSLKGHLWNKDTWLIRTLDRVPTLCKYILFSPWNTDTSLIRTISWFQGCPY